MIRLSFAALALLLMLTAGCVFHRNDTARSEYRTETTRTHEGNSDGTEMKPGEHSQQSESVQIHRESTTTERSHR